MNHRHTERPRGDAPSLLPRAAGVGFAVATLLHFVPLLDPMEVMLLLYLRVQAQLCGAPEVDGAAYVELTDQEVAGYLGCNVRSLQRWRKGRYGDERSALKLFVPDIQPVYDYQGALPVVAGYGYVVRVDDPAPTEDALAMARFYAARGGIEPVEQRVERARQELLAKRLSQRRAGDKASPPSGDRMSPAGGDRRSPAGGDKTPIMGLVPALEEDMAHVDFTVAGCDHPTTDSARQVAQYREWLAVEVSRIQRAPLTRREYWAFWKWWRAAGAGPADRVAGEVRESLAATTVGNKLGYLMACLKAEAQRQRR